MKEYNRIISILKELLSNVNTRFYILIGTMLGFLISFIIIITNKSVSSEDIISLSISAIFILSIVSSLFIFSDGYKSEISSNEENALGGSSTMFQKINNELSDIVNRTKIHDSENMKKMIDDIISQNIILRESVQKSSNIEKQLIDNIEESKINAERLFKRSSYSLIIGGAIAISGVLIFYIFNLNTDYNKLTKLIHFLGLIPRFGILFFIEYVAFFFLKQYRVLMEEYRYYEAIKRDRQNLLSIYYLVDKYKDEKEILELMNNYIDKHSAEIPKYSGDNRVKMEKSWNEDMDVISKITKLVQVIKTSDKSKE